MISKRLLNVVLAVAVTLWAADFVADLVITDYQSKDSLSTVLLAIIGGSFALQVRRSGGNGGGKDGGEK